MKFKSLPHFIEYSAHFFTLKMMLKILPVHYTWKVAEKGFKMTCND
jgi:hypothetical protein